LIGRYFPDKLPKELQCYLTRMGCAYGSEPLVRTLLIRSHQAQLSRPWYYYRLTAFPIRS
jgi:hypothetical protein